MASITRFHVSWMLTAALPEAVSGAASPALSTLPEYASAFNAAPEDGAIWIKPWGTYNLRHKYWAATLSPGYARADGSTAWIKQAPLRRAAGYMPTADIPNVAVRCERYLFPSGVGMAITATFEGELSTDAVVELHRKLCQDNVFAGSDGTARSVDQVLWYELRELERDVLGGASAAPEQSELTTVTTIAGASSSVSTADATSLLTQLCYPGQPPGKVKVLTAKPGKFTETLRVAGSNSQASWSPQRSTTAKGKTGLTCYHHNLVLSGLQVSQLLGLVELGGDDPQNAPDRAQQLYKRAGTILGWAYGSKTVYSTSFAAANIDESGLVDRINTLRKRLSSEPPIFRRS